MTAPSKGSAARAYRPAIHDLSAKQLVELSLSTGETAMGVYSPDLARDLSELGEHDSETEEWHGYDGDELRWSVRLHVERTAQQERQHHANLDHAKEAKARASRSGTRWGDAERAGNGEQRMTLRMRVDDFELLDELVDDGDAGSRSELIAELIRERHASRKR